MALDLKVRYNGQVDVDDPGYPQGKARNAGAYQDGTGTPLEKDLLNDTLGFQQSLLSVAGISPSGTPDRVGASDYLIALQLVATTAGESNAERVMLANWVAAGSLPAGTFSRDINWIGNLFVATGTSGAIHTSPDGVAWTTRASGVANTLLAAVGGDAGVIVAVGEGGAVTRSTDGGINWTAQTSGTTEHLNGVTHRNGEFVAVGENGTLLTSPDGVTWTAQTTGTTEDLNAITFDGTVGMGTGTQLVAVGDNGTILTSPDGVTWTARVSGTSVALMVVAWKKGIFVAGGTTGTIVSSPDGINWTGRASGTTQQVSAIVVTDYHFVAMGLTNTLLASSSGLSWSLINHQTTFIGQGLAWNGRVCIGCSAGNDLVRSLWRLPN